MEPNIQEVMNSFSRQIAELSFKLAVAEATLAAYEASDSTENEE
jgi:hypothetical protein